MQKITYASLGSLGEEFHQAFEDALSQFRLRLGKEHPLFIRHQPKKGLAGSFKDLCPADTRLVLGQFQMASQDDTRKAIAAAKKAFGPWRDLGWKERVAILRQAAALMETRQFELAALLALEVGKNRFEAIAEVSEAADLIRYYCAQMEANQGYDIPLARSAAEQTRSVLKPHGVWAVVSPFNFPLALATGMATGALLAGNTVVFKPASDTPFCGLCLYEILRDAGVPPAVFNYLTGAGNEVGATLVNDPDMDGFIFTGSREVGLQILQRFKRKMPKPCITEMGGKNPALIMPSANLDDASEGVFRSAFGMGGQKCSACSRVYVHQEISKPFMEALLEKTKACQIGDPLARDTFLGPIINERALKTYQVAARLAKNEGRIVCGGKRLKGLEFDYGFFVEPTIVDKLPKNSRLLRDELFIPFLAVATVATLKEAIALANQGDYGLTAGIFTRDPKEQKEFFDHVQAGVTYCNRRGGATTGAWPGVQSFGGWKSSGSSGKSALGPYYVAQFMREQSQTIFLPSARP